MTENMQYPIKNGASWSDVGGLSLVQRMILAYRNARYRRRGRKWKPVGLTRVSAAKPNLGMNEIVLICIVKNAEQYLRSLLLHYRGLGVSRFAFVDDRSIDQSRTLLLEQDDVDLYESDVDFRGSAGGLLWRDKLVDIYGRNRWYVSIDADEYLVFPGSEDRSLQEFIKDLERHGLKRSLAVMLDMYPDGPLGNVDPAASPESLPTVISPLHDRTGYRLANEKFCTAIRGGPRHRLFGVDMRLSKFPVIFADAQTSFASGSHHGPLPIWRNFSSVHAVLLHFKFPAGAVEAFRAIAESGTHFGGSEYYRAIVEHANFGDETDFRYEGSGRYKNSEELAASGFIQDLRPSAG
jgi:hypothetical protein